MRTRNAFLRTIPRFQSEMEEARFWEKADSTLYFPSKGDIRLKLPPRTVTISLRLPKRLLERLRRLAQIRDVPYQSLMKIFIDERVSREIATLKKVA